MFYNARSGIPNRHWWSPGIIPPNLEPYKQVPRCASDAGKHTANTWGCYRWWLWKNIGKSAYIVYIYILYIYITMIHIWFIMDGHWKIGGHAHRMSSWAFHGDFHGDPLGGELKSSWPNYLGNMMRIHNGALVFLINKYHGTIVTIVTIALKRF